MATLSLLHRPMAIRCLMPSFPPTQCRQKQPFKTPFIAQQLFVPFRRATTSHCSPSAQPPSGNVPLDKATMVNRVMCEQRRLRGNPEKSLLSVTDLSQQDFHKIMGMAARMKSSPNDEFMDAVTKHKKIALIFQKTSTRTKESFLTGAYELGMMASYIDWNTSNFMLSELEDEIKVLSQWYDIIMTRVPSVPGVGGLQTIRECFGNDLSGVKLAYVGDGNNVCNSLIEAAALAGVGKINVSTPAHEKYMPLASSREFASRHTVFERKADLRDAIRDADIVYTDTWVSMGSEHEAEEREEAFKGFNINGTNTALASPHHVFMHYLPAHPGKEVVLRGQHSVVFRQAQNRKHAQKALMRFILEG